MRHFEIRYSMKRMLAATTLVAIACFALALPTIRASKLANLVRSGQVHDAEKMLLPKFGDLDAYRQVLHQSKHVHLQPLDMDQLIHFKRRVVVSTGWVGAEVELEVGASTISKGGNSFRYY